jgi:hypothetical protein
MAIGFTAELSHYTSVGRYAIQAIIPAPAPYDSLALPAAAPAITEASIPAPAAHDSLALPAAAPAITADYLCPLKGPPFIPHTWSCGTIGSQECCEGPTSAGGIGRVCCPTGTGTGTGTGQCAPGLAQCPEYGCTDLGNDPANCGGCGVTCPQGTGCFAGECLRPESGGCPPDYTRCGGTEPPVCCLPGSTCFNGTCSADHLCPPEGPPWIPHTWNCFTDVVTREECCQGPAGETICCPAACPSGLTWCPGLGCVDLQSDSNHCGSCEVKCSSGQGCCGGECLPLQPDGCCVGYTKCDGVCCVPGSTCSNGICLCSGSAPTIPNSCGLCGTQVAGCSATGQWSFTYAQCRNQGVCHPYTTLSCGLGSAYCGGNCQWGLCSCDDPSYTVCGAYPGQCVDTSTDVNNCGSCDYPCGSNEICCAGICADTSTDASNCGACGAVCETGTSCVDSSCTCPAPSSLSRNNNYIVTGSSSPTTSTCEPLGGKNGWLTVTLSPDNLALPTAWSCSSFSEKGALGYENTICPVTPCQNPVNIPGVGTGCCQVTPGFTLQLNAYPAPGSGFNFMQFVILYGGASAGSQVVPSVQYWAPGGTTPLPNINNQSSGNESLGSVASTLNSELFITLKTDSSGNVVSADFEIAGTSSLSFDIPQTAQVPIYAFEVVVVGPDNCSYADFTTGSGDLTYTVASGQLCLQSGSPWPSCAASSGTAETSNLTYSAIQSPPSGPGELFAQCCGDGWGQGVNPP